ncbi:MAG: ABC transporter ATP-binding protein [Saprospiraceae bacterium]|nr:ABC transporter ATP-binding protein [Saprospiraceae bacterium]
MPSLLEIENLTIRYEDNGNSLIAVDKVSLTANSGEITAIMGETGSGKSTIGKSVLMLMAPNAQISNGKIRFDGLDLCKASLKTMQKLRGKDITTVAQNPYLAMNPVMRCGSQAAEVIKMRKKLGRAQVRQQVLQLFVEVDLTDPERIYQSYPHQVSIGELQRVCIAMAIAPEPRLVIADEPFSSVDPINRRLLASLFRTFVSKRNVSMLLITHKIEMVDSVADRWYLLRRGQLIEHAETSFSGARLHHPYAKQLAAHHKAMKKGALASDHASEVLFQVKDLSMSFGSSNAFFNFQMSDNHALKEISMRFHLGDSLGIVGKSGSGKSTLGKIIGGLIQNYSGSVMFRGREVQDWINSDAKSFFSQVQYLMQDAGASLPPRRRVSKVLIETLNAFRRSNRKEQLNRAARLLKDVELEPGTLMKRRNELSGGEQQRVCIARALAANPQVLVLDESLNSLDKVVQSRILALLHGLQKQYQLSILLISHDLTMVSHFCRHLLVLDKGIVVEAGKIDDILTSPKTDVTRSLLKDFE